MSNNAELANGKGILLVLSGPSGVGKGTVCTELRKRAKDLVYSVSCTTRLPRQGEQDGVNYFFKTKSQFQAMIENDELLEWAEYVGNYYGTPRQFVQQTLDSGRDVILEIEVQGALKVKQTFPEGVFIFLLPPSFHELEHRIVGRGTETTETIRSRMSIAKNEIALIEHYDYAIVNDQVELACERVQCILEAERYRQSRMLPQIQQWMEEVH